MQNTAIYSASERVFPSSIDIDYYIEVLTKYPEGEWFAPNNSDGNSFTICREFAMTGIIAHKQTPNWVNGSFRGLKHEFLYRIDMNY